MGDDDATHGKRNGQNIGGKFLCGEKEERKDDGRNASRRGASKEPKKNRPDSYLRYVSRFVLATVRLEFDEFLGHFVVGALRQNPQNGPTGFVHMHAAYQREPASARTLSNVNGTRIFQ